MEGLPDDVDAVRPRRGHESLDGLRGWWPCGRRQSAAFRRAAHRAHESLEISTRGHGEPAAAPGRLDTVRVRNAFWRDHDRAGLELPICVLDVEEKLSLEDVKYFVLGSMDVKRRRVPESRLMFQHGKSIGPVGMSDSHRDQGIEKPDLLHAHAVNPPGRMSPISRAAMSGGH